MFVTGKYESRNSVATSLKLNEVFEQPRAQMITLVDEHQGVRSQRLWICISFGPVTQCRVEGVDVDAVPEYLALAARKLGCQE